jgi:hypothetical protein
MHHKLIVSQLRNKTSSKPEKDLRQAATLIEAGVERYGATRFHDTGTFVSEHDGHGIGMPRPQWQFKSV